MFFVNAAIDHSCFWFKRHSTEIKFKFKFQVHYFYTVLKLGSLRARLIKTLNIAI